MTIIKNYNYICYISFIHCIVFDKCNVLNVYPASLHSVFNLKLH